MTSALVRSTKDSMPTDSELLDMVRFSTRYEEIEENGSVAYRSRKYKHLLSYTKQEYISLLREAYYYCCSKKGNKRHEIKRVDGASHKKIIQASLSIRDNKQRMRIFEANSWEVIGEGKSNVTSGFKISTGKPTAVKHLTDVKRTNPCIILNRLHDAIDRMTNELYASMPEAFIKYLKGDQEFLKIAVLMARPYHWTTEQMHMACYRKLDYKGMDLSFKCRVGIDVILGMMAIEKAGFANTDLKDANVMWNGERGVIVDLDEIVDLSKKPRVNTIRSPLYTDAQADYKRICLLGILKTMIGESGVRKVLPCLEAVDHELAAKIKEQISFLEKNNITPKDLIVQSVAIIEEGIKQCCLDMHYFCLATTLAHIFIPSLQDLDLDINKYVITKVMPKPFQKSPGEMVDMGLNWQSVYEDYAAPALDCQRLPESLQEALSNLFNSPEPLSKQIPALLSLLQSLQSTLLSSAA